MEKHSINVSGKDIRNYLRSGVGVPEGYVWAQQFKLSQLIYRDLDGKIPPSP